MIKKIGDMNYYEILEVSPTATAHEILRAYERMRRIYEPNSIALYSLFTPEESSAIFQKIEEAYRTLAFEENRKKYDALLRDRNELPVPDPEQHPPSPPDEPRNEQAEDETSTLAPDEPREKPAAPAHRHVEEFTGPVIRELREALDLSLRNISDRTKIGIRHLECIEEETFQKLPPRTYIRGFLMLYATAIGCDPEQMSRDYLRRYDAAMVKGKK